MGKSDPQAALDFWPTPFEITRALLGIHPPPRHSVIIEPSAGDGSIASVLRLGGYTVIGVEIQPRFKESLEVQCHQVLIKDWLAFSLSDTYISRNDSIACIGNPPYKPAKLMVAHVEHALQLADYVAMLLPCTFLHSYERVRFNRTYPVNGYYPIAKRPSCSRDTSVGKRDLSWFVWDKRMGMMQRIAIL